MTGNQDRAERAANWAGDVLEALKPVIDDCVAAVTADTLTHGDVAGAERKARAVGVIARSARAVASLAPKPPSRPAAKQEDDMIDDDRDDSPESLDRIRTELESRLDGLRAVIETKRLACEAGGRRTSQYEDDALRAA